VTSGVLPRGSLDTAAAAAVAVHPRECSSRRRRYYDNYQAADSTSLDFTGGMPYSLPSDPTVIGASSYS